MPHTHFKAKLSYNREFKIVYKESVRYIFIDDRLIQVNYEDLQAIKKAIEKLEEFKDDNSNTLLKKFRHLESEKKLYSPEEFERRFSDLAKFTTRQKLTEAIKEAIKTSPRGYKKRAFIRKILNLLFEKYKIGKQQGNHFSGTASELMRELEIDIKYFR